MHLWPPESLSINELEVSVTLYRSVLNAVTDSLVATDEQGIIRVFNPAAAALFDLAPQTVLGQHVSCLMQGDLAEHRDSWLSKQDEIDIPAGFGVEVEGKRGNGDSFLLYLATGQAESAEGRLYVAICRELSTYVQTLCTLGNREQQYAEITGSQTPKQPAKSTIPPGSQDSLTGLLNRTGFSEALQEIINTGPSDFSLVLLNIDRFDIVNETLNHAAGDVVLKIAGQRLTASLSKDDVYARLDADEFIVLLRGVTKTEHINSITNRLQARLSEPFEVLGTRFNLTASAGICPPLQGICEPEVMMRKTHIALREAKTRGLHERVIFCEELERKIKSAAELELGIRRALHRGDFQLHYQPKFWLESGEVQGVEALLRWTHPEWGPVSPAKFIPFAESHGLIAHIGHWVINEAARQWREWTDAGYTVPQIAVNISAKQLEDPDFLVELEAVLGQYRIPASALELEITESAALNHSVAQAALINQLKHVGLDIAIDDFGTGYSSLSSLSELPANTLKIDRAFIGKIMSGANGDPVIEAVIALGRSMGMKVVAEGVETEHQAKILRRLKCDVVQGYLYAKPMPASQILSGFLVPGAHLRNEREQSDRAVRVDQLSAHKHILKL